MKNHFYNGIKMHKWIDQLNPKCIVELGCGFFENALLILGYLYKNGTQHHLIGISDGPPFAELPPVMGSKFTYLRGITFDVLPHLKTVCPNEMSSGIDILIVDSDHNYYTVQRELETAAPHLAEKCIIAFHDTNTLEENNLVGHNFLNMSKVENSTYEFEGYKNGSEYPIETISKTLDLPITMAIEEFITSNPEFRIIEKSTEHCGCWLIGRNV